MTVLITGASGLLGPYIIRRLIKQHKDVVLLDRVPPKPGQGFDAGPGRVVEEIGDITDRSFVADVGSRNKVDGIIHMATVMVNEPLVENPVWGFDLHVNATQSVLEIARAQGAPCVYFSSQAVYGGRKTLDRITEDERMPILGHWYGTQKIMGEMLADSYRNIYGVNTVTIRPNQVFGPKPSNLRTIIDQWVRDIYQGKSIHWKTGGDYVIGVTYFDDLAAAAITAMERADKVTTHAFNIESGVEVTLKELAAMLKKLIPTADISIGDGIQLHTDAAMPPLRGIGTIDRAERELDFRPTAPEQGLRHYLEWVEADNVYGRTGLFQPAN